MASHAYTATLIEYNKSHLFKKICTIQTSVDSVSHCSIHNKAPFLLVLLVSPLLFEEPRYIYFSMQHKQSKRCRILVHRLSRRMRCQGDVGKEMIVKNLKLYIENMSIIEENKRLRKKASLLHQENLELKSEIQKKFSP